MEYISSFLKLIDFSSVKFGFHINGKDTYSTHLGGLLYLLLGIFLIFFIVNSIMDLISRKSLQVITVDRIMSKPPEIDMINYNLNFAFLIGFDENKTALNQDLLDNYFIQNVNFITIKNGYKVKEPIEIRKCQKDDLLNSFNHNNSFYIQEKFKNYNCFKRSNFTLNGAFNDEVFQYIEYGVSLNWTTVKKENMNFLNSFYSTNQIYVELKYFDYSIDLYDFETPIKSYEKEVFDYINFNNIKRINTFFSSYSFENDQNLLISISEKQILTKLHRVYNYFFETFDRKPGMKDFDLLFKFYIRSSEYDVELKRIYKKLPNILSEISGLASNFLFIIILFNSYYNRIKAKEELVNLLFRFRENYKLSNATENKVKNLIHQYKNKHENNRKGYSHKFEDNKDIDEKKNVEKFSNLRYKLESNNKIIMIDNNFTYENKKNEDQIDIQNEKNLKLWKSSNKSILINLDKNSDFPTSLDKNEFYFQNVKKEEEKSDENEEKEENKIFDKFEDISITLESDFAYPKEQFIRNPSTEFQLINFNHNLDNEFDKNLTENNNFIYQNNMITNLKDFNRGNKNLQKILDNDGHFERLNKSDDKIITKQKEFYITDCEKVEKNILNKVSLPYLRTKKVRKVSFTEINQLKKDNISQPEYISISKQQDPLNKYRERRISQFQMKREFTKNYGKSFSFNFSSYELFFNNLFCLCKKKSILFNGFQKSCKSIDNNLNIYIYLKAIEELKILKELYLKNEETIFNFIAKPMICVIDSDLKQNNDKENLKNLDQEKDLAPVLDCYSNIIRNPKLNEIEYGLLERLNVDLEIFC